MGGTEASLQKQCDRKWKKVLANQALCERIVRSFGAWLTMLPFLTPQEQICLQLLCLWVYGIGVPRAIRCVPFGDVLYFPLRNDILELRRWSGNTTILNTGIDSTGWCSVQVGNRIFQIDDKFLSSSGCRMLEKVRQSQFEIIKRAPINQARINASFCNMDNRYVFATGGKSTRKFLFSVERYDIARDIWEEMPSLNAARAGLGSCALRSAVYVFCGYDLYKGGNLNSVEKLETLDLEAGWQLVQMPPTSLPTPSNHPVVAALNPSEILILGGSGMHGQGYYLTDELVFDTRTNLTKVVGESVSLRFCSEKAQGQQTLPGAVVALVKGDDGEGRVIKYEKGEVHILHKF